MKKASISEISSLEYGMHENEYFVKNQLKGQYSVIKIYEKKKTKYNRCD